MADKYGKNQMRQIRTNIGNFIKDGIPRYSYGGYWCYKEYIDEIKNKKVLDNRKQNRGVHSGMPKKLVLSIGIIILFLYLTLRERLKEK